ncbi:uncharacterized protein LOC124451037 [Xenia sp. Carnegie-2017]|uniref:uncharacterized protein LOC124451037 n=1 Tax=Xenia sp. Carnegie-2017 TaxID=2897299 RepID=UPI001F038E11|nr:uncharacterized protein LOC124451037 [Xenia sp. Carnegie-2017]
MLEELIAFILSVLSLFTETARVSFLEENNSEHTCVEVRDIGIDVQSEWYINKEYEEDDLNDNKDQSPQTKWFSHSQQSRSFSNSMCKSFWATSSLTLATIFPTLVVTVFLYVSVNIFNSCLEWQNHNNNTLPLSVKRAHVFGSCFETSLLYLWFPFTMMILFGWREFKAKFLSTVYVGVIFGELAVMYHLISFQFNVYDAHSYYRVPPSILFCVSLLCSSFLILDNIRSGEQEVAYSNCHIITIVLFEFVVSAISCYVIRFTVIPAFIGVQEGILKFFLAATSPVIGLVLNVICKYFAQRKSSDIIDPSRSFILVYIIRGGAIFLYRTLQANFKSIWLFIGLSLFSAVLNFVKKATQQIRFNIWKRIIATLNNMHCFHRLRVLPWNTAHARRLRADLDIQDIIFEYSTLVFSQAYFIFYLQSFEISMEPLLLEFLKRVAISFGIDFIFNCLSNQVQMYCYNVPISCVWRKYWKRHLLANVMVGLMVIAYFSADLITVFRTHFKTSGDSSIKYVLRNCSLF